MCGKADDDGCGSAHNHVVEIDHERPVWLPPGFRAQARGEFTWVCTRCNSFPATKWPHSGGAWAGMMLHLGNAHHVGQFKGMNQRIDMIAVQ
jgi:hypothetical protein